MNPQQSDRVLVIKAKGGFGNRILSAVTGVVLAEIGNRSPVIDWRDGMYAPPGVNAYQFLFDDSGGIDLAQFDDRRDVAPDIWSGRMAQHPVDLVEQFYPDKHSSPFVYRRLSIDMAHPFVPQEVAVFWSYLPKMARLHRHIRHSPTLAGRSDEELIRSVLQRYFRPNRRITDSVEEMTGRWSHPAIGVHVRYTDRKVPLAKIEKSLSALRRRQPESPVFLATDSQAVQDRLRANFPGVVTIDKAFARGAESLHADADFVDPLTQAENALIDMWTLSRCSWLVHSRNSTFSVAAALIGGIPSGRQVDVERNNPRLAAKRLIQSRA